MMFSRMFPKIFSKTLLGFALFFLCALALGLTSLAAAQESGGARAYVFSAERVAVWLDNFRKTALEAGVSEAFFDKAFELFEPNEKVVAASNYQPEFKAPPGEYIEKRLSEIRISHGKRLLYEKAALLEKLERLYGVDRHILVAIWGIETNYGTTMGGHNVIYALATLAIEGRRKKFAEQQLLALLPMLEKQNLPIDSAGSWAGAMGHMQFIPTTYAGYARDVDGDGKRDIWHSLEDSLGSAAYYLKRLGWVSGMAWGMEVATAKDFVFAEQESAKKQTLKAWLDEGYAPANGDDARQQVWQDRQARLIKITAHAPAFLVTKNFDILLKYNSATIYALAVGRLADRLRGAEPTKTAWLKTPLEKFALAEIKQAQTSLNALGFSAGDSDGIIGQQTLTALHSWQESRGLEKTKITKKAIALLYQQATFLTKAEIKQLQSNLSALGFDTGGADGLAGEKTRAALRAFQEASGFVATGAPSRAMLIALSERIKQEEAGNDDKSREQREQPAGQPAEFSGQAEDQ